MKSLLRSVSAGLAVATLALGSLATAQAAEAPAGLSRYQEPTFPVLAQEQGIFSGSALVGVAWNDDGTPADVAVLGSSHPLFARAALESARAWRRDGRAAGRNFGTYNVRFEMAGVVVTKAKMISAYMAEARADQEWRVLSRDELDREPRALVQPMPDFPASAREARAPGRVVVNFFVDSEGRVCLPTVEEATSPAFAPEALAAVRQWRFEPPRKNGRSVVYAERWVFDFKNAS